MTSVLKEVLTHSNKKGMISWVDQHPEAFETLVDLALSDDPEYAWRSAWLLWSCVAENDPRLKGRIKEFIAALPGKTASHKREFLILLSKMDIEQDFAVELFEHCVVIWTNPSSQPSLRFNAFKMLYKITGDIPELKPELQLLVDEEFLSGLSENARKSVFRLTGSLK